MAYHGPPALDCADLRPLLEGTATGWAGCCPSCHEDEAYDPGSYPLLRGALADGRRFVACCGVRGALEAAGLLGPDDDE